ncbi:MAG: transposase [bacterium]
MTDLAHYKFQLLKFKIGFIPTIAANTIIAIAKKKNATPGIFLAIHTFSRDIDNNVHIHLSATNGGISKNLKRWVVHLQKPSDNHRINIDYIGKYLKRPPIGETRIKNYDGIKKIMMRPSTRSYHQANFSYTRSLLQGYRYFGFLANRVRAKLLPIVYGFFAIVPTIKNPLSWRDLIIISMHYDPLLCPNCHNHLQLSNMVFTKNNFQLLHETIINKK